MCPLHSSASARAGSSRASAGPRAPIDTTAMKRLNFICPPMTLSRCARDLLGCVRDVRPPMGSIVSRRGRRAARVIDACRQRPQEHRGRATWVMRPRGPLIIRAGLLAARIPRVLPRNPASGRPLPGHHGGASPRGPRRAGSLTDSARVHRAGTVVSLLRVRARGDPPRGLLSAGQRGLLDCLLPAESDPPLDLLDRLRARDVPSLSAYSDG